MVLILIILIAVGVVTNQPRKYYLHVLIAFGVWLVLVTAAVWVGYSTAEGAWGILGMLATAIAWAVPGAIIAFGYRKRPLYRLIPGKRRYEGND